MSLNATDFVPLGPIRSADIKQFVDLFTGVMTDQPVTLKNAVTIGGSQGASTSPLKLYGAVGQVTNLIDLYPDSTSLNPTFGFAAHGQFAWGAGGTAIADTFLSRIGVTGTPPTDKAGLRVQPDLLIDNDLRVGNHFFFGAEGSTRFIQPVGADSIRIAPNLIVDGTITLGTTATPVVFSNPVAGSLAINNKTLIAGANAAGSGLTFSDARLQVRAADLLDAPGANSMGFSAYTIASNWMQMNLRFQRVTPGTAWPGVAGILALDVDASPAAGGQVVFLNGRVGLGGVPDPAGQVAQAVGGFTVRNDFLVQGNSQINGSETVTGALGTGGRITAGTDMVVSNGNLYLHPSGDMLISRVGADQIGLPGTVWVGHSNDTYLQRGGANILRVPNTLWFADNTVSLARQNIAGLGEVVALTGRDLYTATDITNAGSYTMYTPTDPQGGGQIYRVISASNRPASQVGGGEIHMAIRLYCDGDITAGTYVHGLSFISTSDPRLKSGMTVVSDAACMTRVRDTSMEVFTYQLPPPISGSLPRPTDQDIGFDATDVYRVAPEFSALDYQGTPVAVNYGQMVTLLWGALRALDARCVAKGV